MLVGVKLGKMASSISHDLVDCDGNDWLVGNCDRKSL